MQFFVPHASDEAQAESVRDSVKAFLAEQGFGVSDRRIFRVHFRHNGQEYTAEVGRVFADLREQMLVILEGINPALLYGCTASRGVVRGEPYLIGRDHLTHIEDFES